MFLEGYIGTTLYDHCPIELSSVTIRNGGETGHKKGLSAGRAAISAMTAMTGNHAANLSFLDPVHRLASV